MIPSDNKHQIDYKMFSAGMTDPATSLTKLSWSRTALKCWINTENHGKRKLPSWISP